MAAPIPYLRCLVLFVTLILGLEKCHPGPVMPSTFDMAPFDLRKAEKIDLNFVLLSKAFEVEVEGGIADLVAIREELMIATQSGRILRYSWEGQEIRDYSLDLRRIPFCVDQQVGSHLCLKVFLLRGAA